MLVWNANEIQICRRPMLLLSRSCSLSLSLFMCVYSRWQDSFSLFVCMQQVHRTRKKEKKTRGTNGLVDWRGRNMNFFDWIEWPLGRRWRRKKKEWSDFFLLLLLLFFHHCHCVIDGSNRMCVHKTFPVSHIAKIK